MLLKSLFFLPLIFFNSLACFLYAENIHDQLTALQESTIIAVPIKKQITNHLLPTGHPYYKFLSKMCKKHRITKNKNYFKTIGFVSYKRFHPHLLIGYHPKLPNYIIKSNTDTMPYYEDQALVNRVVLAAKMQYLINKFNMKHIKIPKKWVYILPKKSAPSKQSSHPKGFIVVAEMLSLTSFEETKKKISQEETFNKRWIKELFIMFHYVGFTSLPIMNIGFIQNKQQLAFYDLEKPTEDLTICQTRLKTILPKKWKQYWEELEKQWK